MSVQVKRPGLFALVPCEEVLIFFGERLVARV